MNFLTTHKTIVTKLALLLTLFGVLVGGIVATTDKAEAQGVWGAVSYGGVMACGFTTAQSTPNAPGTPCSSPGILNSGYFGSGICSTGVMMAEYLSWSQSCIGTGPPAVNCTGSWSTYGSCTAKPGESCGAGNGTQSRSFVVTTPESGGGTCPNRGATQSRDCDLGACVPNRNCIGSWVNTGSCSAVCGGGTRPQRYDITQTQSGTGNACPHADGATRNVSCNTGACACTGWWYNVGSCNTTCGTGSQRQRWNNTGGGPTCDRSDRFVGCSNYSGCPAGPDLTVSSVSLSSGTLDPGTSISLRGRVSNDGDVSTGSSFNNRFRYRLNNAGWITIASPGTTALGATFGRNITQSMIVPNNPGANFDVQVCADSSNAITESSESNNCRVVDLGNITAPLTPTPGACDTARATNHAYNTTAWPGGSSFCTSAGGGTTATFPAQGSSATWTCYGQNTGSDEVCTATRAAAPGCGTAAAGTYTTQPTANLCSSGSPVWSDTNGNDGAFDWSCGATTCSADHRPDAPTGLSATPQGCGTNALNLDWNDVAGATSYSVYSSTGVFVGNTGGSDMIPVPAPFNTPGQTYNFYVRANSPLGIQSANSITFGGTTPDVCNGTPTANAGGNQTITLPTQTSSGDASGSTDPDGDPLTFSWAQVGPTPSVASISDDDTATPTFNNLTTVGTYIFEVTVSDGAETDTANMTVRVNPAPDPDPGLFDVQALPGSDYDLPTGEVSGHRIELTISNSSVTSIPNNTDIPFEVRNGGSGGPIIYSGIFTTNEIVTGARQTEDFLLTTPPPIGFAPGSHPLHVRISPPVDGNPNNNEGTDTLLVDLTPPSPMTVSVNPTLARQGNTTQVQVNVTSSTMVVDCTVSGPGVSETQLLGPGTLQGNTWNESFPSGNLSNASIYTLSCTEMLGGMPRTVFDPVTALVEVVPAIQEI